MLHDPDYDLLFISSNTYIIHYAISQCKIKINHYITMKIIYFKILFKILEYKEIPPQFFYIIFSDTTLKALLILEHADRARLTFISYIAILVHSC
jgi:hypothetical protein